MSTLRRISVSLILCLWSVGAWAVCPTTTLTFKDAAGTTQTLCFGGASGAFIGQSELVSSSGAALDGTAGTSAAGVLSVQGIASGTALGISAASLPLPTGAATSANQSTLKAASTPSVTSDTSSVIQINPGQPNLTTPLNVSIAAVGGTAVVGDPCQLNTLHYTPISITTATTTVVVTGVSAKKTYVCGLNLLTGAANNVAVMEGTTATTCGTSPVGVIGGATAANGLNFAANGGETFGTGVAAVAATATANDDLCLITSSVGPLAGVVKWVQQ